ncbi:MAG: hypothetical protein AMR96_06290 [Candidatus Adiutrix intracellularis]|jgi:tRNA (guanine-N7-)-methyltransferase|nr:MAG: hypothetical protein AMR96_06290 [Candidatus Adiutrix intracellularis]MDR2826894.1 hypothetical protein [Candidatus Adiutrix intracellularis]
MLAFSRKYYRSLEPLLKPVDYPQPLPWAEIFGRQAPLELEIGFGNGEYLNRASLMIPDHNFVGLEVAWASLKRALRRLATPPSHNNVKVILTRAEVALERFFLPESLTVLRTLFPRPWPAERQAGRRIFERDFLNLVADRLESSGRFSLVTDSRKLADWVLAQAQGSALTLELAERPAELNTKYERKWQGGGQQQFYHLTGYKNERAGRLEPIKETKMQAFYRDYLDPTTFSPRGCVEAVVVRFREFIFDPHRAEGLLRVFVIEDHLTQDFFIRLRQEPEGRWKVSPAVPGQVFPTIGVARALELAAS